ncbi:MAG: aminotransferase class V-fold PLP-dependent enzyme [Planctomycetota bacterium]|nr:aminotransferase class V-fold PLP-dependent enzyme [Planctomycetota bacterium]
MLYFDCNATVPLHPAARRAWLDVTDRVWHNPSSLYAAATAARDLLDDCRERLADLLVCDPARIIFTAGATAAVNMLARHLGRSAPAHGGAVISAIEHPCVRESFLAAMPGRTREIPVNGQGVVALDAVADLLDAAPLPPGVVSVMAASNEVGTIQPWRDVAHLCHARHVAFHTDAAQWLGKLPARGLGDCDWVSGSGHKYGGPKGVGFLVVPIDGSTFRGDRGGPQEDGRHAGTEDVAAIAAMLAALEAREQEIATGIDVRAAARDAAERRLQERLPVAIVVGQQTERLWNTSALIIPGADGRKLVSRLERAGVAASTGSACSAGSDSTSRITTAIGADALGITATDLRGMVRLSAGWDTPAAAWMKAADAIVEAVRGDGEHLPRVSLTEMR